MTRKTSLIACVLGLLTAISLAAPAAPRQGCLEAIGPDAKPLGPCPLKHTEVKAYLSGFTAYVQVEQVFENPYDDKIEAVYTFPLGSDAAVSEMTMQVGDRVIFGSIKPRDEAKQIYEEAKEAGHVAGLLDQERPNIFTQAVANIEPGKKITITIAYSETLDYDAGASQWVFPMVVGPRYVPGSGPVPTHRRGDIEPAPKPSSQVDDADKVNPPVTPKGTRA
jgi:Ca-activated chloride channel family protein